MPSVTLDTKKSAKQEKNNYFFMDEILPDFQTRLKRLKEKTVPDSIINNVGMETINADTHLGKYFVDFASSSTIHGLNHLVAPHRHPVERFLAVLFIVGALVCLILLSLIFWNRYQHEATVINLDNYRQMFQMAKPAFIICPVNNVDPNKITSVFKKHGIEHTSKTENFFKFLSNLTYENIEMIPDFDEVPSDKWMQLLYDLRIDITNVELKPNVSLGMWIISEKGICLTVRSIFAVYASFEYWMTNNQTVLPIPDEISLYTYAINAGNLESLSLEQEVFMSMTDPYEMIRYETPMRLMRPRVMEQLTLLMSQITTAETVKELRVGQRKCKYPTDGGLKTWPVYSRNMCITECRMQIIQDNCNCRPHFAKPIDGVPICNVIQLRCIANIIDKLFLHHAPPENCDCVPNCNLVNYEVKLEAESRL